MRPTFEGFSGVPVLIHKPIFLEMTERVRNFKADYYDDFDKFMADVEPEYEVVSNIAIIRIHGSLSKGRSWWQFFFGGTNYGSIERDLRHAVADGNIRGIVLDVDSPGGVCNGCFELTDVIRSLRGDKPIVTYANGLMCSAALCLGTAADRVVVSKGTIAGSLGVILARYDWSKMNEEIGMQVNYITSGEAKADGYPDAPMSDPERDRLQAEVNALFQIFLQSVADGRGMDLEKLRASAGDARVFIGQESVDAGLADRVGTLPDVIAELSQDPNPEHPKTTGVENDVEHEPESRSRYARWIRHSRSGDANRPQ